MALKERCFSFIGGTDQETGEYHRLHFCVEYHDETTVPARLRGEVVRMYTRGSLAALGLHHLTARSLVIMQPGEADRVARCTPSGHVNVAVTGLAMRLGVEVTRHGKTFIVDRPDGWTHRRVAEREAA